MVEEIVKVVNPSGLHLRPAGILSNLAKDCDSNVEITKGDKHINPKSVLNIMAAGIRCGEEIQIRCTGETEQEDLKKLVEAIQSGLGESVLK